MCDKSIKINSNYKDVYKYQRDCDNKKELFIINSIMKTGSDTLLESFWHTPYTTQHIHNLNEGGNGGPFYKSGIIVPKLKKLTGKKIYIISSYRNPFERYLSYINHQYYTLQELGKKKSKKKDITLDYVINKFQNYNFYEENNIHEDWIKFFNYDYLNYNFDFKKKIQIFEKDNYVFINLRFKDINDWEKILKDNLNIDKNFKINPKNKTNLIVYKNIKKNLKLNSDIIHKIYSKNKKYIEHFYSKKEIEKLNFFRN